MLSHTDIFTQESSPYFMLKAVIWCHFITRATNPHTIHHKLHMVMPHLLFFMHNVTFGYSNYYFIMIIIINYCLFFFCFFIGLGHGSVKEAFLLIVSKHSGHHTSLFKICQSRTMFEHPPNVPNWLNICMSDWDILRISVIILYSVGLISVHLVRNLI